MLHPSLQCPSSLSRASLFFFERWEKSPCTSPNQSPWSAGGQPRGVLRRSARKLPGKSVKMGRHFWRPKLRRTSLPPYVISESRGSSRHLGAHNRFARLPATAETLVVRRAPDEGVCREPGGHNCP